MKTNREKFYEQHDLPKTLSLSLPQIAMYSGMPVAALQEVYNRGVGAWKTNIGSVRLKPGSIFGRAYQKNVNAPRSQKLSAEQWAYGRLFAFVMKTPKVFYGADKDIAERFDLL